ncbi:MAG: MarR family transcriptional regulator [Spirochaetales bacterium]|nr:MarR family transcriptional regulator [Spirochaetales bacterium]
MTRKQERLLGTLHEKLRLTADELAWLVKSDSQCCGVTTPQVPVLLFIKRNTSVSLSDISKAFPADTSSLSRTVDNLVKQGYITRSEKNEDRRSISLSLSEEGEKLAAQIEKNSLAFLMGVFAGIPEKDRETVADSLIIFADALKSCRESGCCGFDFFRKEK